VAVTGSPVVIGDGGQLGATPSSGRFKDDVKPMDKASEAILSLQPVTFHYKKELDSDGILQFGLVAEDVEKVNRDLVARDEQGKPYSVRYEAVNAMLLNEFLKEHRKVEKLESTVAQQRKDFEAVVDQLKAQIQKVSAQLEASKLAPQVVNNP
jgi:endosialidase-like protein